MKKSSVLCFALIVFACLVAAGCHDDNTAQADSGAPVVTVAAISFIIPDAPVSLKSPIEPITKAFDWQKIDILFCTDEPVERGGIAYFEISLNGLPYESKVQKLQPGNCWTCPFIFPSTGEWSFELSIESAGGAMSLPVSLGPINVK